MIPLWQMSILSVLDAEDFSFTYDSTQKISISGKKINNEWIINVQVHALPYFAWGCSNYKSPVKGRRKKIICYYLTLVLNKLSEHGVSNCNDLIRELKSNFE